VTGQAQMATCVALLAGGGRFSSSAQAFLEGCKKYKICYNSDMLHHKHNGDCMKNRKYAFTLAEVLVTLGIIGVVSAMTVPSLMQNYQRQSYVTQLHKVYNELSQALVRYQNDKNAINLSEAGMTTVSAAQNFIKDYLKVVAECPAVEAPCFASSYKTMSGANVNESYFTFTYKSYVLASGAAVRPAYSKANDKIVNICVDINGQKGPNIVGRDLFFLAIYNNGIIDTYSADVVSAPLTEDQRTAGGVMWKPFGDILNANWQMDY